MLGIHCDLKMKYQHMPTRGFGLRRIILPEMPSGIHNENAIRRHCQHPLVTVSSARRCVSNCFFSLPTQTRLPDNSIF